MAHGWRPSVGTVLAALGHFGSTRHRELRHCRLCFESGVDINKRLGSRTLLHAFAHQGDITGHGGWWTTARINPKDEGNNTPSHKACERNSTVRVVELLVNRGASLTGSNNNGEDTLSTWPSRMISKRIAAYLRGVEAKPALVDKGNYDREPK